MNRFNLCAAALAALCFSSAADAQQRQGVLIATASPGGVYYPLGGSICRLFNFAAERHGLRCAAEISDGSVANVKALLKGEVDVAIVQSDVLRAAMEEAGEFMNSGAGQKLRVLFGAHDEPFTLIARPDSGIKTSSDLIGKRINIGTPGSGFRQTMDHLASASELTTDSFAKVLELDPQAQVDALCAGQLDAIVYMAGNPNGLIQDATSRCNGRITPVPPDRVASMIERHGEYRAMDVPGGLYANHPNDIPTFGTLAVVVTTIDLKELAAYELVRSVFDDFDEFVRLHPAFAEMTVENSARSFPFISFHEGALRYLREKKLTP